MVFGGSRLPLPVFINSRGEIQMNKGKWSGLPAGRWALICALLSLGSWHVVAQQKGDMKPKEEVKAAVIQCPKVEDMECAEFKVRYFQNGRVQFLDSRTGAVIPACRICNP